MATPSRLGKYEIRRELGKGSMGVVYEAFDPFIERRVAIKIIRQDQLGPSQTADLLARLKREAQAAGRLNHPGIVAIYDYGEDSTLGGSGVAYISMELIDGRELKDYFDENHHFNQQEVVRIMGEVLSALQHAHERGVTHRDIKPSNVILLRNGHVKVADFGVARLDTSELTQAGTMIGTPMYMSPEQILGLPVDGRSDLFACGVMLYQFLTGEKPFTGSITTVMQKVLHHEPVPATQINADLSPAWDNVLRHALAKKPEDRFPSATAMAEAIAQAARQQQDAVTVLIPRKERSAPTAAPTSAPATPTEPGPPTRSSSATLANASATAGTAEAVRNALATTTMRLPSPPPPAPPVEPPPAAARRRPVWLAAAAGGVVVAGLVVYLAAGSGRRGESAPPAQPASAAEANASAAPASGLAPVAPAPASVPVASVATSTPPSAPAASVAAGPAPAPKPAASTAAAAAKASIAVTARASAASGRPASVATAAPVPTAPAVTAPPVAAPPAPGSEADWRQRIARLEAARGQLSLADTLGLLLAPLGAEERALATDFETQLRLRPGHGAVIIGASDGLIRATWQTRAVSAQRATELALKRCRELPATRCEPLFVDGELRRDALVSVARELSGQAPAAVRARMMRGFERALAEWRAADGALLARPAASSAAAAPKEAAPAPTPYTPPVTTVPAAPATQVDASRQRPPPADWTSTALAQLSAEPQASFARAMALLLHIVNADDLAQLERLQAGFKRMRWYSAVAFGEKNGRLVYAYAHSERIAKWAQERALADCNRAASAPCVLLLTDGSFHPALLHELAPRLAAHTQASVREQFVRSAQRTLQVGGL